MGDVVVFAVVVALLFNRSSTSVMGLGKAATECNWESRRAPARPITLVNFILNENVQSPEVEYERFGCSRLEDFAH